jgi:hypothetical protein
LEENKPSTDDTIEESLKKKVEIARGLHIEVQKVSGAVDQAKAELGRLRAMELDKRISEIRALNKKLIQSRRDYDTQNNAPKAIWKDGIRFEPKATKEEVQDWLSKQ